jgi:hypothetical protein
MYIYTYIHIYIPDRGDTLKIPGCGGALMTTTALAEEVNPAVPLNVSTYSIFVKMIIFK